MSTFSDKNDKREQHGVYLISLTPRKNVDARTKGNRTRAAIYVRSAIYDIQAQESKCRQYAQRKGYVVQRVYADNDRTSTSFAPALFAMLRAANRGIFDVLVVADSAQMSHPNVSFEKVHAILSELHIKIEFASNQ